jgi:hypothetical protein
MLLVLIIAILLLVIIVFPLLAERNRKKIWQGRFVNRDSVEIEDIYNAHYKNGEFDKADFINLWTTLAKLLHLDPNKLSPSDRFDTEFANVKGYFGPNEIDEVINFLTKECKFRGIDQKRLETIKSLDDCIRLVCKK